MSRRIPRLQMNEMAPALAEALEPRVKRLGYLGEFFQCAAHQPDALLAFMDFTDAAKGGLTDKMVELIALTVAVRNANAYERNQHERLSIRRGYGQGWLEAVERLAPDGQAALAPDEIVVQTYVLKALERAGTGSAEAFGAVVTALGHEQAIAVMMVVGRYITHGLFVNTLELDPPVPSVFEDGFTR
jgi:hypothetical protein